jgi:hypothetical protein
MIPSPREIRLAGGLSAIVGRQLLRRAVALRPRTEGVGWAERVLEVGSRSVLIRTREEKSALGMVMT